MAAKEIFVKIKRVLINTGLIEACRKERAKTKWKINKLTNVTVFAVLLRGVPMGCKDAVLPEILAKDHTFSCLPYKKNTRKPYNDNHCHFRGLILYLHGNGGLEAETSKMFTLLLEKIRRTDPASFQDFCMIDIPIVEDLVQVNIFLYDIDFVNEGMIGQLARRRFGIFFNNVRLLRHNSHVCYVTNINALFEAYRCPSCGQLIKNAGNLERHLTTCKERVRQFFHKNVYQFRETLFDKLDTFGFSYTDNQKLPTNMAIFYFESICLADENFKVAKTTTWIGIHIPISVPILSNLTGEPIFFCNLDPRDSVSSFLDALENLATQS